MKRISLLFLCLSIVLTGCALFPSETFPPTQPTPTDTIQETTEPSQTQPPATLPSFSQDPIAQPMVTVSVPVNHETTFAEDGTQLFDYASQTMYLTVPDSGVADTIIPDFLNRVDTSWETAEALLSAAQADYDGRKDWIPYLCSMLYNPVRLDQSVLSMYGSFSTYRGSAHPEHVPISVTYDLTTGKALTLADILVAGITPEAVAQRISQVLDEEKDKLYLYPGYDQTVLDLLHESFTEYENWYLSSEGLCFYYPQYELAPYASGVVCATIVYDELTGFLNDSYFPTEVDAYTGTLQTEAFAGADLSRYRQFAELILQEDREKALLYTDGTITNVRISQCVPAESSTGILEEAVIFAATSLTAGDAILVEGQISDTVPQLLVRWESRGEQQQAYLMRSNDEGGFRLIK